MKRRSFIKKAGIAIAMPYILPTGRLFAASGARVANHVVICLYAGGLRNIETVQKAEGNLMPNLLAGTEPFSPSIASAITALPRVSATPLQNQGTLFKEFRYADGPAGHYQGNVVALTGKYTDYDTNFNEHVAAPTVFEYYRKHNSASNSALNSWWISNGIGENENISYSTHPDYGAKYAANFMSPLQFIPWDNYKPIDLCKTFGGADKNKIDQVRTFLNQSFNNPLNNATGFQPTEQERAAIDGLIDRFIALEKAGNIYNDWGVNMNGDMFNVFFAEEVIKQHKPELLVVNMSQVDVCHSDFTSHCNNLYKADHAAAHLWQTIQNTPGMANDTVMIIVPEHGRDWKSNTIRDQYGRNGLDHGGDAGSKEIFCMVLGPPNKVYQNNIIGSVTGQSIDVVPTVAHILGFNNDIPSGLLNGSALLSAFK